MTARPTGVRPLRPPPRGRSRRREPRARAPRRSRTPFPRRHGRSRRQPRRGRPDRNNLMAGAATTIVLSGWRAPSMAGAFPPMPLQVRTAPRRGARIRLRGIRAAARR